MRENRKILKKEDRNKEEEEEEEIKIQMRIRKQLKRMIIKVSDDKLKNTKGRRDKTY